MQGSRASLIVGFVLLAAAAAAQPPGATQWKKTIECADGREYREARKDAGRSEYCERVLAGGLAVKDGPSRAWLSEGRLSAEGRYDGGRKVGRWRECDRFERCRDHEYAILAPGEKTRGVTPVVPLSYVDGRYVFDFGACWSTWVSHGTPEARVDLNIYGKSGSCRVTYTRGAGSYLCTIPYSAGVRELDSLDLKSSLAKAGVPHSCK